jgi:hypothetical protein
MGYPYSTRFLAGNGFDDYITYEVPAGYRAVVRQADVAAQQGSSTAAGLLVAGVWVAVFSLPGGEVFTSASWSGMAVAYAGELIQLYATQAAHGHASGYLFIDDT